MWFLGKGGGVLAQGGVICSSAQNRDWPLPEWESAGGGKAGPALLPPASEGLEALAGSGKAANGKRSEPLGISGCSCGMADNRDGKRLLHC